MTLEQLKSGLIVPVQQMKPVKKRPPLEVDGEDRRKACQQAMALLSYAMDLIHSAPGGIVLPDSPVGRFQAHRQLHKYVGEMLLGDEYQGWEEYT